MGYCFKRFKRLSKATRLLIKKFKISGIIISNTTDKNRENLVGKNKKEIGGLSGEPLINISNDLIKKFYKQTPYTK